MDNDGVRKVKEYIAFLILTIFIVLFIGFVVCAIFIIYDASPIISFIVGVIGGIIFGWAFSCFWHHDILED